MTLAEQSFIPEGEPEVFPERECSVPTCAVKGGRNLWGIWDGWLCREHLDEWEAHLDYLNRMRAFFNKWLDTRAGSTNAKQA